MIEAATPGPVAEKDFPMRSRIELEPLAFHTIRTTAVTSAVVQAKGRTDAAAAEVMIAQDAVSATECP